MDEHTIWMKIKALYKERNSLYATNYFGTTQCVDFPRKRKINVEIIELLGKLDEIIFPKIMKGLGR